MQMLGVVFKQNDLTIQDLFFICVFLNRLAPLISVNIELSLEHKEMLV